MRQINEDQYRTKWHLLVRLSISEYKEKFVLKGGMLVAAIVGLDNRATMDLDTTLKNLPLTPEAIHRSLEDICDKVLLNARIAPVEERVKERTDKFFIFLSIMSFIIAAAKLYTAVSVVSSPLFQQACFSSLFLSDRELFPLLHASVCPLFGSE